MKQNETNGQTIERLAKRVEFLENGMRNISIFCVDKNHKVLNENDDDYLSNTLDMVGHLHEVIDRLNKQTTGLEDKLGVTDKL